MSAYLDYFTTLERVRHVQSRVPGTTFGRHHDEFLRRGWVAQDGYLTHVMVPFLDSQEEVAVEIDEDAGVFRYQSPQKRNRTITQPLTDIALYRLRVDAWLNDVSALIGIEPRRIAVQRNKIPNHLWHLGDARIAGTHDFAPVFVGRLWSCAPQSQVNAVLCDPIWSRAGMLLHHESVSNELPRDHVMRGLYEFVRVVDGQDMFDADAFDRVLRGFVNSSGSPEPEQFLQGNRVKLPHFEESRLMSDTCAAILKLMWGGQAKTPPIMKWAEVKLTVDSGYRSFDEAFGGKTIREEYLDLVKTGGHYQIRRH